MARPRRASGYGSSHTISPSRVGSGGSTLGTFHSFVGQPAAVRQRSGTCPMSNRLSQPGSAKSYGSSCIPTPSSGGAIDLPLGPEARYEQKESISLAFVTALQVLPPRQVAVLVLRDVLGFRAKEVADMLDATVESVNGALKRARASLERRWSPGTDIPPPSPNSPSENALVAKFVRAWESAELDALVALLTEDVYVSMPPMPFEYEGRDVVARFCASIFSAGRMFDLVPTRANGDRK